MASGIESQVLTVLRSGPRFFHSLWRHVGGEWYEFTETVNAMMEAGSIKYVPGRGYTLRGDEEEPA